MKQVIEAELTWTGERFERGLRIAIDDDGRIEAVGNLSGEEVQHLDGQALLPGFVSAHSHAFQRGLRGRGERFPAGAGTFWSWREAMYALVEQLDDASFYAHVRAAFEEMLSCGITTVGEFHYLHHSPRASDFAFDEIVLHAARDAGIRIVLLLTHYRTGGIGKPLSPAQQRFDSRSLHAFWKQADALASGLDLRTQSIGVAAHSVRGVPLDELAPLYAEAGRRGMPFHMHVEEQRKEIEECVAAYGRRPMQLILERLEQCDRFTAVHATHTDPGDLAEFLARGGRVCITPLTEANLGDGIPFLRGAPAAPPAPGRKTAGEAAGAPPSLGTDSNARISMIEEMRWLEYAQRLRSETRGVFRDDSGANAWFLLDCATSAGASSLGLHAGRIETGAWADFAAVDLHARAIEGVAEDDLLDAIIFGASDEIVRATFVGGRWREWRKPRGRR